jgi:hypothetical protein
LPEIDLLPAWYTRKLRHRRMARAQAWLAVVSGLGLICCLAAVVCHGKGKPSTGQTPGATPTTVTTAPAAQ